MRSRIGNLVRRILDTLLPPRKDEISLRGITAEEISEKLSGAGTPGSAGLWSYKNDFVRSLIWELKFHRNQTVLACLADILYEHLLEEASDLVLFGESDKILLVPIPTSALRLKERGFNGVEVLLKSVIALDEGEVFEDGSALLKKIKEVPRQTKIKNRAKRIANVRGVFTCPYPEDVHDRVVFVIDDVTTTGATLAEAVGVLREAGAKEVKCFTLAH
jgi:ComF family protein